jgi:hypothetical protein
MEAKARILKVIWIDSVRIAGGIFMRSVEHIAMIHFRLSYKPLVDHGIFISLLADSEPPPAAEVLNALVIVGNVRQANQPGTHCENDLPYEDLKPVLLDPQSLAVSSDATLDFVNLAGPISNIS